jgi:hypothetical protein
VAKANIIQMELNLTTREKVLVNSTLRICVKPHATKRALELSIEPLALVLILKTHLKFITCLLGGSVVNSYVLLFVN